MKMKILAALMVAFTMSFMHAASAATIRENTAGTALSIGSFFWGQKVTTGSGGPWTNIDFNFYNRSGSLAVGNIYVLSQTFTGAANSISAAAPGFLASASASASGAVYSFGSGLSLAASADYWFYTDTAFELLGDAASTVTTEQYYFSSDGANTYLSATNGVNYTLAGDVAPVPVPASLPLLAVGLGGLGYIARRKRKAA